MRLNISHMTRYDFAEPVPYGLQQVRLTPMTRAHQTVLRWTLRIEGGSEEARFNDQHMNIVDLIRIDPERTSISLVCEGEVETREENGIVGPHDGTAPLWYFRRETPLTKAGTKLRALIRDFDAMDGQDVTAFHDLARFISSEVVYRTDTTLATTTAEDALASGQGVCQDHAHIFIAAARLLGYPARYVSGYLFMDDRVEQEAGHAWAEVHIDGLGWVGFDVSNGISPDERYVKIATGLDYSEAAPVVGVTFGGGGQSMLVSLQVQQ